MEFISKNPKVFILCGKSGNGKTFLSEIMKDIFKEKNESTICLAYADQLKEYAKHITDWDGKEETKPRELLQQLGSSLVRGKLNDKTLLIRRVMEDISVYAYFFDNVIITDARFAPEIDMIKEKYKDAVSIHLYGRDNLSLTEEQRKHDTETSLDDYNNYDFSIDNSGNKEDLINKIKDVLKEIGE